MPKEPTTELERKRAAVHSVKRWIKRIRLILAVALAVLALYVGLSFRVNTLPGVHDPDSPRVQSPIPELRRGDTLLLLNLNLWRKPKLNDIVIYDHPDPREDGPIQMLGRIAGLPGESLQRVGPTMAVAGRPPLTVGFDIGPEVAIQDGDTIPQGHYLILYDTDAVAYADSRDFGFVPQRLIRRKVVMNLSPLFGGSE
jgi:signal peptidase I